VLKGVDLEEALRRTSDPAEYQQWLDAHRAWSEHPHQGSKESQRLRDVASDLLEGLRRDLVEQLISGDLVASGFKLPIEPDSRRVTIAADLWELLDIDFARSEAEARGIRLIRIEVLKPAINVTRAMKFSPILFGPVPDKGHQREHLPADVPMAFTHSADFSKVELGPHSFTFGAAAANVLRLLDQNSARVGGWMHGKTLMAEAGANGTKVGDLFKRHIDPSWKLLIESDGRGHYRLKVRPAD
jgi:hypothetical protein